MIVTGVSSDRGFKRMAVNIIEINGIRTRFPYSLRHVPRDHSAGLVDTPASPAPGDIVIASVERIATNSALELNDRRRATLHEGDVIAAVFGNRYATLQFEGLAQKNGECCDLLSKGGLGVLRRYSPDSLPRW